MDALEVEFLCQAEKYDAMITSSASASVLAKYGDPLALPGKVERYAFWPKMKEELPLLFLPAIIAVCTPWTPLKLERVNSLAGIIMNRLRSNMKRETPRRSCYRANGSRVCCMSPRSLMISWIWRHGSGALVSSMTNRKEILFERLP